FNLNQTTRYSSTYDDLSVNRIDTIDVAREEYAQEILGFSSNSSGGNPTSTFEPILSDSSLFLTPFEGSDFILEEIDAYLKDESVSPEIDHADYEPIDSAFARFNTIITSLKALDEGYSSKKYLRKFLRALHPKWIEKVTTIEESKDLTSLSLDELIGNLKVHEMVIKKDSKIVKAKVERKSLALNSKKEYSDEECSNLVVKKKSMRWCRDDKNGKSDRKCFRYSDPNHLIGECLKPPKDKNQRAFVKGSWSDSSEEDDEKAHNRGNVIFGSNLHGNIIGKGTISNDSLEIDNVEQVGKTPYRLLRGRKPTLDYFRVFESKCFILNTKDYLTTFDPKSYEGVFLGYSQNRKSYIILNKHTMKIEKSLNVTFNETPPPSKTPPLVDDDLDEKEAIKVTEKKNLENDIEDETLEIDEIVNIKESMNHPLENVIGTLNQRTLRPDIMFSVCLCARFQKAPKTSHLEEVKPIFRYIKDTTHLRLWYTNGTGIEIVVYANSDHAGDYVDQKSTSGICTFVGCCLTPWFSKKQTALAISTTEAEYVSVKKACQQTLWMKQALIDYDIQLDDVLIMCDNKGAIDLSKNPMQHS
nr:retrovirus-related Pol polyprotein from transposon TNT 1-94 [Tanacetum cinerariifolium]